MWKKEAPFGLELTCTLGTGGVGWVGLGWVGGGLGRLRGTGLTKEEEDQPEEEEG